MAEVSKTERDEMIMKWMKRIHPIINSLQDEYHILDYIEYEELLSLGAEAVIISVDKYIDNDFKVSIANNYKRIFINLINKELSSVFGHKIKLEDLKNLQETPDKYKIDIDTLECNIIDNSQDVNRIADDKECHRLVDNLLLSITLEEASALCDFYKIQTTAIKNNNVLKLRSYGSIRDIRVRALRKLRHPSRCKTLYEFLYKN